MANTTLTNQFIISVTIEDNPDQDILLALVLTMCVRRGLDAPRTYCSPARALARRTKAPLRKDNRNYIMESMRE